MRVLTTSGWRSLLLRATVQVEWSGVFILRIGSELAMKLGVRGLTYFLQNLEIKHATQYIVPLGNLENGSPAGQKKPLAVKVVKGLLCVLRKWPSLLQRTWLALNP